MNKILFGLLLATYSAISYYFVSFLSFIGLGWSENIIWLIIAIYIICASIILRKLSGLKGWVPSFMILIFLFIVVAVFAAIQDDHVFYHYARTLCPGINNEEDMPDYCIWPMRQCWAILGQERRSYCHLTNTYDEAMRKKDLSICEKNISDKAIERELCYSGVAYSKRDPIICDKISTEKIRCNCYLKVAYNNYDTSLCGKCANVNQCKGCSTYGDLCYVQVAKNTDDSSVCGMIQEIGIRDRCYNNIAIVKKDSFLCSMITDLKEQDSCHSKISN